MTEDRNKTSDSFLKNENHSSLTVLLLQRASRLMTKELYNIMHWLQRAESQMTWDIAYALVLNVHSCVILQQRVVAGVGARPYWNITVFCLQ